MSSLVFSAEDPLDNLDGQLVRSNLNDGLMGKYFGYLPAIRERKKRMEPRSGRKIKPVRRRAQGASEWSTRSMRDNQGPRNEASEAHTCRERARVGATRSVTTFEA